MDDIKRLDLNLLRALDALLDERSVTRAADRLGLSQPAVSGMLTRLRESFADPLFVRTQRGIVPTVRAMQLAEPLKGILGDVEALMRPTHFEPATASFALTVAATDYALQAIAIPYLAKLRRLAPFIRVCIRPLDDGLVQAQLERGDLDLVLTTPKAAAPDLHMRHLFDERYDCVLRAGHPDAAAGSLSIDRFCALDHALVSYSGERFRGVTDDALAEIGRERRVVLSVTSFLALVEILRMTDLIAVVPRRLAAQARGLVALEPPIDIPGFTKVAVWHGRTHRDPGHQWVRTLLFELGPP